MIRTLVLLTTILCMIAPRSYAQIDQFSQQDSVEFLEFEKTINELSDVLFTSFSEQRKTSRKS